MKLWLVLGKHMLKLLILFKLMAWIGYAGNDNSLTKDQGRYFIKGENREYIEFWATFSWQLPQKCSQSNTRPANMISPLGASL